MIRWLFTKDVSLFMMGWYVVALKLLSPLPLWSAALIYIGVCFIGGAIDSTVRYFFLKGDPK